MKLNFKHLGLYSVLLALVHPSVIEGKESPYEITVPRLEESAKIDGILNDEVWNSAASFSNFSQVEPKSFAKPSQKTEVKVFSTSKARPRATVKCCFYVSC